MSTLSSSHHRHQHQDDQVGTTSSSWSSLLSSSPNKSGNTFDERQIAKAALDAAEEQLQSLCASHSGTFVSVERRGRTIVNTLNELIDACEKVIHNEASVSRKKLEQNDGESGTGDDDRNNANLTKQRLPSLSVLSERHRVRRRTLLQHSSLIELVELPSLMDACIRSSLYEEAIQIASFGNTLERRHNVTAITSAATDSISSDSSTLPGGNSVVAQVVSHIRARQNDFRRHLLHRLKSHVTMPECLEIVTSLRRLDSIDLERMTLLPNATTSDKPTTPMDKEKAHATMELKLQVDFLEARDVWIDTITPPAFNASSTTTTYNSTRQLQQSSIVTSPQSQEPFSDTIERYRTRVFEIATQFNTIFRSDSTISTTYMDEATGSIDATATTFLSMWISRRIYTFCNTLLAAELAITDDAAVLRDILDSLVFFATSMGRLGADFTAVLARMFETRMHTIIVFNYWKPGIEALKEILKVCRDAGVAHPLFSSQTAMETDEEKDKTGLDAHNLAGPQPPPRKLLRFPPLARFVNAILSGLNELRRCLLPGIFTRLRQSLDQCIVDVLTELNANERAVMKPGMIGVGDFGALRKIATELKSQFHDIVEPYVRGSLEAALGNGLEAERYHRILLDNLKDPDLALLQEEGEKLPHKAMKPEKTVILLYGAPGSGKGTHGPKLERLLNLPQLSTGDILRAAVKAQTDVGKQAEMIMKSGGLVPDEVVIQLIKDRMGESDCKDGCILDGFPRTLEQAKALDCMLETQNCCVTKLLALHVPDEVLEDRICGRWIHEKSGRSYHVKYAPPKSMEIDEASGEPFPETMFDDETNEPLMRQADDTSEALMKRLHVYHTDSSRILDHYRPRGVVRVIDANQDLNTVWEEILRAFEVNVPPQSMKINDVSGDPDTMTDDMTAKF